MTARMTQLVEGQAEAATLVNENFDAVEPAACYGYDAANSNLLTFAYYGGNAMIAGTLTSIADGTVTLTASQTNYIEAHPTTGAVSVNTSAFTSGYLQLYQVVCNTTAPTSITDKRYIYGVWGDVGNGYTSTIWVPAAAMVSRTTSGAASGTAETTTNKIMLKTLDFDASTDEFAQFTVRMPKGWNEGTVTAEFHWSNASGTGNVVWGIQGVAISNDDVLDAAFGTAQTVTDGVTAAGDLMVSAATAAITIGGTPAAGDLVVFQVYRDADNASDTFASDARLHGVVVFFTLTSLNDA